MEFVNLGRIVLRACVLRLGEVLAHDVRNELASVEDIAQSVLRSPIRDVLAHRYRKVRRIGRQHVEEAERRDVEVSVRRGGGDQADRPRHYCAGDDLVDAYALHASRVEIQLPH
jgi:hypothetical protein